MVEDDRPAIAIWDLISSRLVARLEGQRSADWLQEGRYLMTAGSLREEVVRQEGPSRTISVHDGLRLWDVASPPARYRIRRAGRNETGPDRGGRR